MTKQFRADRLRLLVLAGMAAPALMAMVGLALALALRGEMLPDLARGPDPASVFLGFLAAGGSMGAVFLLYKSHKGFEIALKDTGVRIGEDALRMAGYPVMLVIVSTAGIGEEILFRGGLQPSVGVIPAAMLFGFSHGGWRKDMWAYAVAAAVSGGLFGLAYRLAGDLWVPVIAHTLHNIAATFFMGQGLGAAPCELESYSAKPSPSAPLSHDPSCHVPLLPELFAPPDEPSATEAGDKNDGS